MKRSVKIEGLSNLNNNFDFMAGDKAFKALGETLKQTSREMLEESRSNLTKGNHNVTSNLYKSGKVKNENEKGIIQYSIGYLAKYAYYLEFGRKKGKMPPISSLYKWVVKKGLKDAGKEAMSMAWGVAKNIAKQGSKAHPFLFPAFELKRKNLNKNLIDSYKELIKKKLK